MVDKVLRLGLGLIVWIWIARRFGPEGFGLWSYAAAFAALFGSVASLGLEGLLVRELLRRSAPAGALVGTALGLRCLASTGAAAAGLIVATAMHPGEMTLISLVAAHFAGFVLQGAQVIDAHFQSKARVRTPVVAANAAFLIATGARALLLLYAAPIEWLGLTLVLEAALAAVFFWIAYRADGQRPSEWHFDARVARALVAESWPLALSALAVMAYMRLDQIMLAALSGNAAVGQFSAALRVSEVWYFMPLAIATAAFPIMMRKRAEGEPAYRRFVQQLYDALAWLGVAAAVVIAAAASWIVAALYGSEFHEAAEILQIQAWAGIAVSMSFVHGKWLLAEGLQRYGLFYTLVGAGVNALLNFLLIPRYGAVGAAWATLATQFGVLPIQLLLPKARDNFVMMINAAFAPLRLLRRS